MSSSIWSGRRLLVMVGYDEDWEIGEIGEEVVGVDPWRGPGIGGGRWSRVR
jgi:hypothetical protein